MDYMCRIVREFIHSVQLSYLLNVVLHVVIIINNRSTSFLFKK